MYPELVRALDTRHTLSIHICNALVKGANSSAGGERVLRCPTILLVDAAHRIAGKAVARGTGVVTESPIDRAAAHRLGGDLAWIGGSSSIVAGKVG